MKTVKSLTAVAMIAVSFLLNANSGAGETKGINTVAVNYSCGVTAEEVQTYLTELGYTLLEEPKMSNGCAEWQCRTQRAGSNYVTTVYTDGENIVGHSDEWVD